MKNVALTVLVILSCQGTNQFREIDSIIATIQQEEDTYKRVKYDDANLYEDLNEAGNFSLEGVKMKSVAVIQVDKYYNGNTLKKISIYFDAESEDLTSDYYVQGGKLLFAQKIKTQYSLPKWHDDFDEKKSIKTLDKFYFDKEVLIGWFRDSVSVSNTKLDFIQNESTLLHDFNLYANYSE